MKFKRLIKFYRIESDLNDREMDRLQSAAKFVGIPWTPMLSRPKAARDFTRRTENADPAGW
ncbi:MAG: hypothetical protein AAGA33_06935 [Pseudomonadota bacterium]